MNTQAKRGDMVAYPYTLRSTAVHGKTTSHTEYRLAVVTSIDRQGMAKKARDLS